MHYETTSAPTVEPPQEMASSANENTVPIPKETSCSNGSSRVSLVYGLCWPHDPRQTLDHNRGVQRWAELRPTWLVCADSWAAFNEPTT